MPQATNHSYFNIASLSRLICNSEFDDPVNNKLLFDILAPPPALFGDVLDRLFELLLFNNNKFVVVVVDPDCKFNDGVDDGDDDDGDDGVFITVVAFDAWLCCIWFIIDNTNKNNQFLIIYIT